MGNLISPEDPPPFQEAPPSVIPSLLQDLSCWDLPLPPELWSVISAHLPHHALRVLSCVSRSLWNLGWSSQADLKFLQKDQYCVARYLSCAPKIQSLKLDSCPLPTDLVFKILSSRDQLTSLSLLYLTQPWLAELQNFKNLRELSLNLTQLPQLDYLTCLTGLHSLHLERCKIFRGISALKNLTTLQLLKAHFQDTPWDCLRSLTKLEVLELDECKKLDLEVGSTQFLPRLRRLSLQGSSCFDKNLNWLIHLTQIETLDVATCQLTSVDVLSKMPNLTDLDVSACPIAGVPQWRNFPSLKNLNLNFPRTNAHEAALEIPTLQSVTFHPILEGPRRDRRYTHKSSTLWAENLTYLDYSDTLPKRSSPTLCTQLPRRIMLRTLLLRGSHLEDSDLDGIKDLTGLTHLDLSDCHNLGSHALYCLPKLTSLTHLHVGFTPLDKGTLVADYPANNFSLKNLVNLTNLVDLTFESSFIRSDGLEHLQNHTKLRRLELLNFVNLVDTALGFLGNLNLEHLAITRAQITNDAIGYIKHMHNLRILDISRCSGVNPNFLSLLRPFIYLSEIKCYAVTEELKQIARDRSFQNLKISCKYIFPDGKK